VEKVIDKVFKDKFKNSLFKSIIITIALFATINGLIEFISKNKLFIIIISLTIYFIFHTIAFEE
tara:strand:- start:85 stop:276 length:192 start_codon:yes stop_codon:yes gene_type:complete